MKLKGGVSGKQDVNFRKPPECILAVAIVFHDIILQDKPQCGRITWGGVHMVYYMNKPAVWHRAETGDH